MNYPRESLAEICIYALRCGQWVISKRNLPEGEVAHDGANKGYLMGWHSGKFFAYLMSALPSGLVKWVQVEDLSKDEYKGWVHILPDVFGNQVIFLMEPDFFEECLSVSQPENVPELMEEIRTLSKTL